ncbi:acetoacetate decarboxylase family protein [Lacticaseibacillus nasuensis]|uniref:acetoacetate decarboxylase family protein n=1 Tax=Lacticaseibacillus nasuensis TaxID=944671 RepID=UPI002247FD3C|nr:acetoacetate decarboxylase family protein [Lacticaseibacillus nasuensis]MCX2455920.1 acetoacetate decarboxylase family protein [Lacticaseibacillus nasuensis]
MTSYYASDSAVKQFLDNPSMNDQGGLAFAYGTDPAALAKLVPAPLKLAAPVVVGYVVKMNKPNFGPAYLEQTLYALVSYKDKLMGAYPFELLLAGPGAEAGMVAGREGAGIPKKLADDIQLTRDGNTAHASVTRHGTKVLDLNWTAGDINEPSFLPQFAQMMPLNQAVEMNSFFINYDLEQAQDGSNHFINTSLVATQMTSFTDQLEPGKLDLTLASSIDDPLNELPVLKPLGAGWYHFKTSVMHNTLHLEDLDPAKAAPYLLTGRFDHEAYTK